MRKFRKFYQRLSYPHQDILVAFIFIATLGIVVPWVMRGVTYVIPYFVGYYDWVSKL